MESHLLQMRGLKLCHGYFVCISFSSHLLQMRGLKLWLPCCLKLSLLVASFTDAWIETFSSESETS